MVTVTIDAVEEPLNPTGRWSDSGGVEHAAISISSRASFYLSEFNLRELWDECDRLLLKKAHMDIDRENEEMGWLENTADEGLEAVSSSTPG